MCQPDHPETFLPGRCRGYVGKRLDCIAQYIFFGRLVNILVCDKGMSSGVLLDHYWQQKVRSVVQRLVKLMSSPAAPTHSAHVHRGPFGVAADGRVDEVHQHIQERVEASCLHTVSLIVANLAGGNRLRSGGVWRLGFFAHL
mmetsp:Transcript_20768/g.32900  ORF Transcript_20768/g.32900 Transcript_20768/m.32900 type:complete len:142 (+) Transcript_20768:1143-1568(+)